MEKDNRSSEFFDIRTLFQTYLSKWYLFVISVLICVVIAFLYTRISKPQFGVRANIMITTGNESPVAVFGALSNVLGGGGYVEDEIFVISSHSVYKDVAEKLGLNKTYFVKTGFLKKDFEYKDFPVELYTPNAISDTLSTTLEFKVVVSDKEKVDVTIKSLANKSVIGEVENASFPIKIDTDYGQFMLNKTEFLPLGEKVKTTIYLSSYDAAAEALSKNVDCEISSRKSNVISLKMDTPYPSYGMTILNNIVEEYNKRGIDEKNLQGEKTAEFIDERLKLLSVDLNHAESEIQDYKQREGFVSLETEVAYQSKRKGEVENSLIQAETEAEILQMIRAFISNPANSESLIPMTVTNDGLKNSISAYNELIIKRMDIASNAGPNNSALKLIDDQITAMRKNIFTSIDKIYDTQLITVKELKNALNDTESKLGSIPSQEKGFRDLLRQQKIKQELYVYLLQRREETSMLLANAIPKANIIDEAYTLVDPLSTDRKVIWLIGIIIGLLIPPVLLWLKDFFNNKFETVSALKKLTNIPILGEVCSDKSGNNLAVRLHDSSSTSELFRLMRSNLQFILNGKNDKVVMVTSTNSGEGKSFISLNLAATLAMLDNKKVLLVGLDIRKPRLASYLGINPRLGLTQYLSSDDININDLITKVPEIKSLDVIVAGPVPPNPAEMLQSHKLEEFFEIIRNNYDYIVVDSAPVGMVSDTFSLNHFVDATIFVTRANFTHKQDIEFLNDIYTDKRLKKLSIVLNGTQSSKGYGYGYGEKSSLQR